MKKNTPYKFFPSIITTAGILFVGFTTFSEGATLYWDTNGATAGSASGNSGGGANAWGPHDVWSNSADGDQLTIGYIQDSDAVISAGTNATGASIIRINGAQRANSVTFEEGTITLSSGNPSGDYAAGGGSLSIGAGGLTMVNGLNGSATIAEGLGTLVLSASQTWTNDTSSAPRALTVQPAIQGTATTGNTTTLTLSGTSNAENVLQGVIGNGANGGTLSISKSGNSIYFFNGATANTYSGLTTVEGGLLVLNKTSGINAIAGDARITGGSLQWRSDNQMADTGAITTTGGSANFNGKAETINSITLAGGRIDTGNQGILNRVTITNALSMSNGGKLTVNSGGNIEAGSISIVGTRLGVNAADGGNILIGGNSAGVVSTLTVGAGGLSMTGQDIQFNLTATNGLGSQIIFNGDFTGSSENNFRYGTGSGNKLSSLQLGSADRSFNITDSLTTIGVSLAGTGSILNKDGAGALVLTANNSYTGLTSINAGTVRIYDNNALGANSAGTEVAAGAALRLYNNITVTGENLKLTGTPISSANSAGLVNASGDNVWTGNVNLNVGGGDNVRISSDAGTLDIRGNVFIDGGSATANEVGLVITGNGGVATISGNISSTGNNQNLIKTGSSTWVLSGNNTYSGITRVDAGTLSVNSISNNLGNSTEAINLGENTNSGTLRYTGAGESVTRSFRLRSVASGNGGIEQAGSGLLKINGNIISNSSSSGKTLILSGSTTGTGEISGNISNSANSITGITKTGTGTWALSGSAKTFSGATNVNQGTLIASTSLNSSTSLSVTNATFAYGANNVIADSAPVTLGGMAVLQLNGFTDALGVLAITGSVELALGGGESVLTFANSTSADWTDGILSITGWNGDIAGNAAERLLFSDQGLTDAQRSQIIFINPTGLTAGNYDAVFIGNELTPGALIPEPTALALAAAGLVCLSLRRKRHIPAP